MQKVLTLLLSIVLLAGCSADDNHLNQAIAVRQKLLTAEGYSFLAEITVDYGDMYQTFEMRCQFDSKGNLSFVVTNPATIAEITGQIASDGGKLTFDDKVLAFPLIAEGEISPVSAPWILIKSLRSGYLSSITINKNAMHINIDDSYEAETLTVDAYFSASELLIGGEIIWRGRKILTIVVEDFAYL